MAFEEELKKTRSEKISLVTIEAKKPVKLFTLHSGSVYKKTVDRFVSGVLYNGTRMVEATSIGGVTSEKYYYSNETNEVYIFSSNNPSLNNVTLVYKFFLSNSPVILPHDLSSGFEIEWLPLITSISDIGQQLDEENTGIALETKSSIRLMNNDGFFDETFDTLIWEDGNVDFWYWFPTLPPSNAKKVFSGVIENKSFTTSEISFNIKDFVFKIRAPLNLGEFSDSDGRIKPSIIGKPKRRLYGRADKLKMVGIDNTLNGYPMTGTVSCGADSVIMTGTDTVFLSEVSPEDELIFVIDGEQYKTKVQTVDTDTQITLSSEAGVNILNEVPLNKPKVAYRGSNRKWHVTGHRLREPLTQITSVISDNRFIIANSLDILPGDLVIINSSQATIKRVVGNEIVLTTNITTPSIGSFVTRPPIIAVYFGASKLTYQRDWTYSNGTECKVEINNLAEFNITKPSFLNNSMLFTNGSDEVSTTDVLDLRSIIKPRDWIRRNNITTGLGDWYEILQVNEQSVRLRTPYAGTTGTDTAYYKSVEYINDDSIMTCDCYGMEVSGQWINTAAKSVKNIIEVDCGFTNVNHASFSEASDDCNFIVSVAIPEQAGENKPKTVDVISSINDSVFGSLYFDSDLNVAYGVLNANRDEDIETLTDTDIISFSSNTITKLAKNTRLGYSPFTDVFTGERSLKYVEVQSEIIANNIENNETDEREALIYNDSDALIIAQRASLLRSSAVNTVSIKAKALFFTKSVNDKIRVSFDRLFKRFCGNTRIKSGLISSVKKGQFDSEITFTDLGVFNRVQSVAPNTTSDFSLASQEEKEAWGYICDNTSLTPDASSEENLGSYLIG